MTAWRLQTESHQYLQKPHLTSSPRKNNHSQMTQKNDAQMPSSKVSLLISSSSLTSTPSIRISRKKQNAGGPVSISDGLHITWDAPPLTVPGGDCCRGNIPRYTSNCNYTSYMHDSMISIYAKTYAFQKFGNDFWAFVTTKESHRY